MHGASLAVCWLLEHRPALVAQAAARVRDRGVAHAAPLDDEAVVELLGVRAGRGVEHVDRPLVQQALVEDVEPLRDGEYEPCPWIAKVPLLRLTRAGLVPHAWALKQLFVVTVLVITFITTPLSLAFEPIESALRHFDLAVDFLFMADICRNFNTATVSSDDCLVVDQRTLAVAYAKTWFIPDLISSVSRPSCRAAAQPRSRPSS